MAVDAMQPRPAHAQANVMGQWTPLFWVGEQATDCALLRGKGDSTVVVYLNSSPTGKVWLWKASDPTHSPMANVPYTARNFHEGGHLVLPDGRYFTFGGLDFGTVGNRNSATFDPKSYWNPVTRGWVDDDSMAFHRCSATGVALGDGTILAMNGIDHYSLPLFGGRTSGGLVGDMRELASTRTARWASRPNPNPAPAREGASLTYAWTQEVLFGGTDDVGPRNDAWFLQRRQEDGGVRWIWSQMLLVTGSPIPAARSQHTAVMQPGFCDSLCDTLYVFGGRGGPGVVHGDLWRLVFGSRAQFRWRWEPMTALGTGPGARYGHTAVYDPGPPGAATTSGYPRMLVFGGRDAGDALCDNRVWSLTLRPPYRWTELTSATATPVPRIGHAAVFDNRGRFPATKPKRMIVFGGEGASGTLADTWFLFRNNSGPGDTTYTWTQNTASPTVPPARTRAAFALDDNGDRVLIWSGDADGGDASTGLLSDLWALGPTLDPGYPATWSAVPQDSVPPPRAGANLQWWPRGSVTVMTPERFDPSAPVGSRWSRLDWAPKYDQWNYPYMMLTPQGKVLYAGVTDSCTFLEPDEDSPSRGWGPRFGSLFSGASAVAVRPNLFMKSGGDQQPALTGILEVDSLGNTTGWQPIAGMLPRVDHNQIVLPDGRVLVTGGDAQRKNTATAQRQPQLFDPVTRTYSGGLAPDPAIRGYHSTALLLPDARVLSWAGFINNTPGDSAAIYSPPYLFSDAGGTLAPRPEITFVQDTIGYAQTFAICACAAPSIGSIALIRPGSPTHAFDENARFVPLAFAPDTSGTWFAVQSPPNGNWAPPGDYMLFIVDAAGVPSVSKWVRLRAGPAVPSQGCPLPCVAGTPPAPPMEFALLPARPNPSFTATTLAFRLPAATRVTLDVLDVQGRRVRRVADARYPAGEHALEWDGRAAGGRRASPGVYFARLTIEDGRERRVKLVRLP